MCAVYDEPMAVWISNDFNLNEGECVITIIYTRIHWWWD